VTGFAPHEGRRRALHVASASLGLAAHAGMPHRMMTALLLTLVALAMLLESLRRRRPALNAALTRWSAGALRPAEVAAPTGATWLALGYAATWLAAPPTVAAPAMVVAAVADPAAAIVGRWAVPAGGRKTAAGSVGAFATAALVLVAFGIGWRGTLAAAAAAALAERLPGRAADNLAIPLCTAAALWAAG
jgi:dolichol kinase